MFKYIVIGAGLSGSVVAERIANDLKEEVLVIDKRFHIGGNCFDYIDRNGLFIHRYGPHFFHTDDKEVYNYIKRFSNWQIYEHKVLVFIDGKKVPIPINLNSIKLLFPEEVSKSLINKLLRKFDYGAKISILDLINQEDRDLSFFADFIYKKVFYNYSLKQWGVDPKILDESILSRVPIYLNVDDRYFKNVYQLIPEIGYTRFFVNLLSNKRIKILLNSNFKDLINLDRHNFKIYFFNQRFNGKLIFTAKIDELFNYEFGFLPYRTIDFEFIELDNKVYQEVTTVNYPNNYDFTRITEFKHIYRNIYEKEFDKTVILREYPRQYINSKDDIAYYPIIIDKNIKLYNKYKELANKFSNIILLGRLAEYKYYDMDKAIKNALYVYESSIK